jgi:DNA polymerase-3 subunit epsilon
MLCAEFRRANAMFSREGRPNVEFSLEGRAIIDAKDIFHDQEKRSLEAAVRRYLHHDHSGAHSALADVEATVDVLDAMLAEYPHLPGSVDSLREHYKVPNAIDLEGKFVQADGEIRFNFHKKHKGKRLKDVAETHPGLLRWILSDDCDFYEVAKAVVRDALKAASPEWE